jgi:hypothetical protein
MRWVKELFGTKGTEAPSSVRDPMRWRPACECLEERTTPATTAVPAAILIDGPFPGATFSLPSSFDPRNALSITVNITSPNDPSPTITVLWGDETVQKAVGSPGANDFTHQYRVFNTTYGLEVVVSNQFGESASRTETTGAALPSAQQGVVSALYLNLLGRNVDPDGLNHWSGVLASGAPLSQVVGGLMASTEYQNQVINNLFKQYLGRPVDSTGLANFGPLLQASGPEAVAAALAGSSEFFTRTGGTNSDFLNALYFNVLGRSIDPSGMTTFLNALSMGVSREQVAATVLSSPEAAQFAVTQAYQSYLGRAGDATGVQFWARVYQTDPTAFLGQFLSAAAPELTQQATADASVVPPNPGASYPPIAVPLVSSGGATSPGGTNPPGMQPLTSTA